MKQKNNTSSLGNSVLKAIEEKNIKPIPKIYYNIRMLGIYILLGLLMLFSSLTLSIVFSYFSILEIAILGDLNFHLFLFVILPITSMLLLLFTNIFFYNLFKKTNGGYKYSFHKIFITLVVISSLFAVIILQSGLGKKVELYLLPKVGFENVAIQQQRQKLTFELWQNPNKGLVIGKIIDIKKKNFQFQDINGHIWSISVTKNTQIRNDVELKIGGYVKVQGVPYSENIFIAKRIIPYIIYK